MFKKQVSFPCSESQRVLQIQRTYNNTWTILIETLLGLYYIKNLEAGGIKIQVYQVSDCDRFELVSESKIVIFSNSKSSFIVIDLLKESSKSFPFPMPNLDWL